MNVIFIAKLEKVTDQDKFINYISEHYNELKAKYRTFCGLNGYHWDEGELLVKKEKVGAFYSNNLNLTDENGNFLLVQYSDPYKGSRVNVMHMNVRVRR